MTISPKDFGCILFWPARFACERLPQTESKFLCPGAAFVTPGRALSCSQTLSNAAAVDSQFKQTAPRSVSISIAITFQDSLLRVGERYCKHARRGMDGNDLLHIQ